jgi:hypothetical protein
VSLESATNRIDLGGRGINFRVTAIHALAGLVDTIAKSRTPNFVRRAREARIRTYRSPASNSSDLDVD